MATKPTDYYELLGVPREATTEQIRKAYRKLARKYHPDVNPGDASAEEKYKELSQAHEVLADPEKRRKYDQFGHAFQQAQAGGQWQNGDFGNFVYQQGGAGTFEDLFGDLFGNLGGFAGGRARAGTAVRTAERGQDIAYRLPVSFADAIQGAQKQLTLTIADRCPECEGLGGKAETCPACKGTGRSSQRGILGMAMSCPQCQGSGEVITQRCAKCRGGGELARDVTINVKIPPGVRPGQKLRLAGQGGRGARGGPAGDLVLELQVEPHPFFQRDEQDNIQVEVPITVTEALLGGKIRVPTVQGPGTLTLPAGANSGQQFRLRGQGAPRGKERGRGDEIVTVRVVTPKHLTAKQRELVQELAADLQEDPRAELPEGL